VSNRRNREEAEQRRRQQRLWLVVAAVVVAAFVIAVLASSGGGDGGTDIAQVRPVSVTGGPLPTTAPDGQTAPEVAGESFDGSSVVIERGRPTLVLFLAHWCPHCQAEVPRLVEHLGGAPLPDDVDLIAVSTAASPDRPNFPPSEWLEDEGWRWPVLVDDADGSIAGAYGLPGFPYLVALDRSGDVVGTVSGEFPMEEFDRLVAAARG
jgi:cytochrome c biogenesis protein CcmG/thiol:disulfide interchange protein DsbE